MVLSQFLPARAGHVYLFDVLLGLKAEDSNPYNPWLGGEELRFAVHRPRQPGASPRSHGTPCRDQTTCDVFKLMCPQLTPREDHLALAVPPETMLGHRTHYRAQTHLARGESVQEDAAFPLRPEERGIHAVGIW